MKDVDTVPETLHNLADLFEQRNKEYGDNYKEFGTHFYSLIKHCRVNDIRDANRFGILMQIMTKLSRYVMSFNKGGHKDSLHDMAVYAAMLAELDEHQK